MKRSVMGSQKQRKMLMSKMKIARAKTCQRKTALPKVNLMKQSKHGKSSLTCVSS